MRKSIILVLLALGLSACATVPTPLQGQFSAIQPADAARNATSGQPVRWGGEIIKVEPGHDTTCFEILGRNLDSVARPTRRDSSDGRFIACRDGFYDPAVFTKGRDVTVVGRVSGSEVGKVGQFDYTYPKVAADVIYLWPKRPLYAQSGYYGPYYDPFWGPYWGGFWGPTVIVVRDHHH